MLVAFGCRKEFVMSQQAAVAPEKMIFRGTHNRMGRHVAVSPQNSAMKHLCYARIVLNAANPAVEFSNGNQETGLICLSGRAAVKTGGKEFALGQYDSIYIPRDSTDRKSTRLNSSHV